MQTLGKVCQNDFSLGRRWHYSSELHRKQRLTGGFALPLSSLGGLTVNSNNHSSPQVKILTVMKSYRKSLCILGSRKNLRFISSYFQLACTYKKRVKLDRIWTGFGQHVQNLHKTKE